MSQQTPDRSTRSHGEFAELFARRSRTALRGFLPGRRVWSAVGGSAAVVRDQSVVTVESTTSLTSLKVVLKVIQTGGVANTGTWTSLGDKVSVASALSGGELDYVVTLKSGVTLDPGTYTFKFGYNHDQGQRDAGGDRYNVTATSTASVTEFLKGGF
ncbi:hypothetical protein ACGFNV_38135 [Streptomyces sp. NPDC048751]|uniref:hypothetical protein n=1 Tax=Streptomyces sp. NPDC048751 TaxID=3365591 RepID=UPI003722E08D